MTRQPSRRHVLRTVGIAAVGGLAGCSGGGNRGSGRSPDEVSNGSGTSNGSGDGDGTPELRSGTVSPGSLPPYADLLPDLGKQLAFTAYGTASEGNHELGAVPGNPTDPLRYDGAAGATAARAMGAFLLSTKPGFDVEHLGIDDTKRLLGVAGVGVQVLPVEFDAAVADVEGSDAEFRSRANDRAVFVGPGGNIFGLTRDAFVFASHEQRSESFDPVERVRAVVDARTGAARPKHETDGSFATLLRHAETGGSVAGAYAPGSDLATFVADRDPGLSGVNLLTDGFGAATAGVVRLDAANGSAPQPATGTIVYPGRDAIDERALTTTVGTAAGNRSYVRDGATVRVEGTYTWDDLSAYERESGVGA